MNLLEKSTNELKAYIDFYLRQGFNVIPVVYGQKEAVVRWLDYQKKKVTENEIKEWFFRGWKANVAIVCGKVSKNLVVVDFDKPKLCEKVFGKGISKETFVVQTGKGKHVYFKTDFPVKSCKLTEVGIDIKGEGGYVLAPPSLHPSGKEYKEERLTAVQHFSGDFMEELFDRLKKVDKKFDPDKHRQLVDIDKILEGTSEGDRNEAAIRLSTWYRRGELTKEETVERMERWNERNKPPLDEKELDIIIKSAYKTPRPYCYKFAKEMTKHEHFSPEVVQEANQLLNQAEITPHILKALDEVVREEKTKISVFLLQLMKESIDLSGDSGSGKNTIIDAVLGCFPVNSWWKVTGATDKSIRYLPKQVGTLYLAERRSAKGKADEESTAEFDIKLAISEGKLTVIVVERKEEGGFETHKYETGIENVVTTSTEVEIPPELKNRMWELTTDESKEQTIAVIDYILEQSAKSKAKRVSRDHEKEVLRCAMQTLQEEAPTEFIVPYARQLRPLLIPLAEQSRARRDVQKLIQAIRAVAKLHYRSRPIYEEEEDKQIVCLPEDFWYAWRYMDEAIIGTFTEETPRFWRMWKLVQRILESGKRLDADALSQIALFGKTTAWNWLNRMERAGLIIRKKEKTKGRPHTYFEEPSEEQQYQIVEIKLSDLYKAVDDWLQVCQKDTLSTLSCLSTQKSENKKFSQKIVKARLRENKVEKILSSLSNARANEADIWSRYEADA